MIYVTAWFKFFNAQCQETQELYLEKGLMQGESLARQVKITVTQVVLVILLISNLLSC